MKGFRLSEKVIEVTVITFITYDTVHCFTTFCDLISSYI